VGLMDKAKKLAEQAQQKLDEAQQNFNKSASPEAGPEAEGPRYDDHGRPVQDAPPAGEAAPPPAEPAAPATPEAGETPPPAAEPAAPGDGPNSSPDPFKPIQ
jgi:hypothetical protein